MKKLKRSSLLVMVAALVGCSSMSENQADIYANSGESDVINDKPVTYNKRVSHIVTFEFNSSELPNNAPDVVEPHVRFLISNPSYKVALQGNASEEGSRKFNYELAKKRVKAVKEVFMELGIEPEQVVELSVGETQSEFVPQRSVLIVY